MLPALIVTSAPMPSICRQLNCERGCAAVSEHDPGGDCLRKASDR
jgi:hypothetical protein